MKKVKDLREALALTTKAYMKSALKSYEGNIIENAILMTKLSFGNMKPYIEVESLFQNEFGDYGRRKAGLVKLNFNKIEESIKTVARNDIEGFLKEVYDLSQKYVPIDKRYKDRHKIAFLERSVRKKVLRLQDDEVSYFTDISNEKTDDTNKYNQSYLRNVEGFTLSTIRRRRGWYDEEEVNFINDMLRTSNKRKAIGRVFWNGKSLQIRDKRTENVFNTGFKLRKKPLDITKIKRTEKQPTGGYQELKKSGRIVGLDSGKLDSYGITYSAFDKSRKFSTFNYAALQHENLAFKHARGKKPLFLKKALDKVIATYKGGNR